MYLRVVNPWRHRGYDRGTEQDTMVPVGRRRRQEKQHYSCRWEESLCVTANLGYSHSHSQRSIVVLDMAYFVPREPF
jgi:hypothetical protein